MRAAKVKTKSVFDFPTAELADAVAVKALWSGEATPDQQKRAVEWLTKNVCLVGDLSFNLAEGPRASDFTEGKRWVGAMLIWCAKTSIREMTDRWPDQLRNKTGGEDARSKS